MLDFDPRSPVFRSNPYPFYDMLRSFAPMFYWEAWGMWFLTRYDDCAALLRDARLGHYEGQYSFPESQRALVEMQKEWLLLKNPPDHTRLRGLVHKAFTPRMVEQMRQQVQTITDSLLDKIVAEGDGDLIAGLAYPLPVTVIAALLGIPAEDHDQFHVWSDALARSLDLTEVTEVYEKASAAAAELTDYLRRIVAQRRGHLRDDLLSALIAAEEAGDRLSEEELYATCALLLVAGHETTINLIGNGTLALLQNPEAWQQLQANPTLIKTAVEELLRYDSPVQMTSRMALEDMEIRGQTVRRGQQVAFLLGAANHDPERFAQPGTLDLSRDPNPHLAFGNGIHYCLGAPLARLEGQIAISTLLRRLPHLRLAAEASTYRDNYVLRGLESLKVIF